MFSILVCSVNHSYLERLKINLRETTGNEYELLVWDNETDPRPITEVYNLLAARAKYPYWCFIHEDIEFKTNNWSENLKKAFEQHPETGLIGIAGAKYKSRTTSGWSTGLPALDYCNIYHQNPEGKTEHLYNNPGKSNFVPVVNTDGVFMAIRNEVWADTRFNENMLRGFHLYDIDFSFHVIKKWKAAVIFNIDIMHFTVGGNFGDEWIKYSLQWHREFSRYLPQMAEGFIKPRALENKIRRNWLYRLHTENISINSKWQWIKTVKAWQDPQAWPYILLFLIGKRKSLKSGAEIQ
jgi:hypothetical protein